MEAPVTGSMEHSSTTREQPANMGRQLATMLRLQENINSEINPDWRLQEYAWYRAIWLECAELLGHLDWKWWSHRAASDVEQLQLEIVDIWHFGLSDRLAKVSDIERLAAMMEADYVSSAAAAQQPNELSLAVEAMAAHALTRQSFSVALFVRMAAAAGLSFERLFVLYVGKNVLNSFRQQHGYKAGHYRKLWNGREDNEHLAELLAELDPDVEDFEILLYRGLASRYQQGSEVRQS